MQKLSLPEIFKGSSTHYGYATDIIENPNGGKAKKISKTKGGEPPWADHIKGTAKIGPLPFVDNFNVGYGAIDIDIYPAKHNDYIKKLQELEIHRYIMVRSSSGGAHIFFCFKEPIAAWLVVEKLTYIAELLGHKDAEIFPKQNRINPTQNEKGNWTKIGNWIYMPYGMDNSYAMDAAGEKLSLEEFCEFASTRIIDDVHSLPKPKENRKLTTSHVQIVSSERTKSQQNIREVLLNGPPCLVKLNTDGVGEGDRNNALVNFAGLLKKAYGEADYDNLQLFNNLNEPELNQNEVKSIMNSINNGDYDYTCKKAPIQKLCQKHKCINRQYGKYTKEEQFVSPYPYAFIKKRVVMVDTRDGSYISMKDFGYILKSEKYFDWEDKQIIDAGRFVLNDETEKFSDVVFEPTEPERFHIGKQKIYNTYKKNLLKPVEGDISAWTDLIKFLIPDKHYRHLFNQWCAHLIQKPGEKLHWSPLLITKQGSGKGTLHQGIKNCLGQEYCELLDVELLTGKFTGHLENKLLLTLDETKEDQKNRVKIMNNLKMLITEKRVKIERKYAEPFWLRNVCNYMMFSNYKTAVTLTPDARRFMVWINEELPREPEFYDKVWDIVENNPGVILNYYLMYDCTETTDFKPKGRAPITPHFKEVVDATDRPEFTTLEIMFNERNYPFHKDCRYVSIGHLADAFHEMHHRELNRAMIKVWLQWRKSHKKAMDLKQIYWGTHEPTIWTLDPVKHCIESPAELARAYMMPSNYRFKSWAEIHEVAKTPDFLRE